MKRILATLVLLLAACGGAPANPEAASASGNGAVATTAGSADAAPSEEPAATTAEVAPKSSAAPTEPAATPARERPDGPMAPAFELALGEGGTFSLAAESRPVYLVFWAEW
jgi:hypothetical protein